VQSIICFGVVVHQRATMSPKLHLFKDYISTPEWCWFYISGQGSISFINEKTSWHLHKQAMTRKLFPIQFLQNYILQLMWVKQEQTIIAQITTNRCYKPFPDEWFLALFYPHYINVYAKQKKDRAGARFFRKEVNTHEFATSGSRLLEGPVGPIIFYSIILIIIFTVSVSVHPFKSHRSTSTSNQSVIIV
jgi:hypothetical protein